MDKPQPTKGQARVLAFVRKYRDKHGYPPTVREICDGLKVRSPNGITRHVNELVRKGYLSHKRNVARSFVVLDDS